MEKGKYHDFKINKDLPTNKIKTSFHFIEDPFPFFFNAQLLIFLLTWWVYSFSIAAVTKYHKLIDLKNILSPS